MIRRFFYLCLGTAALCLTMLPYEVRAQITVTNLQTT